MLKLISFIIIAVSFSCIVTAQSKSEIKLYNKILETKKSKNIKQFIRKYPNSTYIPTIKRIKDSIEFFSIKNNNIKSYINFCKNNPNSHFTSLAYKKINELSMSNIDNFSAKNIIAKTGIPEENIKSVIGFKLNNKEYIFGILSPDEINQTIYEVILLENLSGKWFILDRIEEKRYNNENNLEILDINKDIQNVFINGEQYLYFTYINKSKKHNPKTFIRNNDIEYVLNLYSIEQKNITTALFSGKTEFANSNNNIIYGNSLDIPEDGKYLTYEQEFFAQQIKNNENLKPFNNECFEDQNIIEWWYNNNSEKSKNLKFCIINNSSKIIEEFKKCKEKLNVDNYIVSYFTLYKTIMVVVFNKLEKHYSLAYCHPAPIARKDKMLNNIYQDRGNTITLYFYADNQLIKRRINLANKRFD